MNFLLFVDPLGGKPPARLGGQGPASPKKSQPSHGDALAHDEDERMTPAPLVDRSSELALPFPLAKQVVRYDRISPFVAGAVTGLFGGGAMVALTDWLMSRHEGAHAFVSLLAAPLHRFLSGPWQTVTGIAYFVVACSVVSGAFAVLTKRLQKLVALMFWTALFFGALWICVDAAFVAKVPWLAQRLPFLPVLAGAEALAIVSCFQLPLRRDRGVIEVEEQPARDSLV